MEGPNDVEIWKPILGCEGRGEDGGWNMKLWKACEDNM
jgi:hypothetical protein